MAAISPKVQRKVAVVDENETVLQAAKVMAEKYIGSVVVNSGSRLAGIFTERDLMRVVAQQRDPVQLKLKEIMRTDLVRANATDSVEHCLSLMRANRCRHLLIFEHDEFVGIVSLRDLAALMLEEKEALVEQLTKYISG